MPLGLPLRSPRGKKRERESAIFLRLRGKNYENSIPRIISLEIKDILR